MSPCSPDNKKIGGFDAYDVKEAARTLIKAKEIRNNNPKFYAAVKGELIRQAEAAKDAALEAKVGKKLRNL